jgi:hypothetical protein
MGVSYSRPAFHWRRYKERYRLLGIKCESCGRFFFPKRIVCPNCRRRGKVVPYQFSGKGRVFSYTVVRSPPAGFEGFAPYIVALIELEEGPKVISQVVDCDPKEVRIGMPVEVCFRRIRSDNPDGIVCYGFKFRPSNEKG